MTKKQPDDQVIGKENEESRKDYDEKVKEAEEWKGKYIRALADYQNLERRMVNEREEIRMFAGLVIIEKLLPIVDVLEKAEEHLKDKGLTLALKEMEDFLKSLHVEKIEALGKAFDPYEMECVEVIPGEEKVLAIHRTGYRMKGKIIRPAKVTVGKKEVEVKE